MGTEFVIAAFIGVVGSCGGAFILGMQKGESLANERIRDILELALATVSSGALKAVYARFDGRYGDAMMRHELSEVAAAKRSRSVARGEDLLLLVARLRELLGWECPAGHEDELEAIDVEMARLGLQKPPGAA